MTDKRWDQLGKSLVEDSLKIQKGEKLMIAMYETESYPLALAVYKYCVIAGGFAQIQFMSEGIKHQILKYGSDEQISWIPEIEAYGMEWADAYIALRGAFNMNECYDIPNAKVAAYQKAMGVVSTLRWQKTRWALIRVPNERFAQQSNVDLEKIMDMFFDSCFIDWPPLMDEMSRIAAILEKGDKMRVLTDDTDLSFSVKGKAWRPSDASGNIPGGEIFTAPVWETVNGHIFFNFPATIGGRIINGLKFYFENGTCVKAEADNDLDYVNAILDSDEGARRIGEFAFGTNDKVDVCTTDILIDEKMGGTIHMAMGRPYDNIYTSSIHWDIIKDTRENSKIYLDNELIFEDGKFLI